MQNNVELELHKRPVDGTALSLVARRLQMPLLDQRSGEMHDHRVKRFSGTLDGPLPVTVAPPDGLAWHTDAVQVWNRTEWVERHGPLPVAFELRVPVPESDGFQSAMDVGGALAGFVARHLKVPVTWVVLDGTAPWPMRDATGHHIRMCFPTRMLAGPNMPSILDRSGNASGFGTRLAMATNTRISHRFTLDVRDELERLEKGPHPASTPKQSGYLPTFHPDPFDIDLPIDDLFQFDAPPAAPETDPAVHPHVARLRREAPRGLGLQDLRDFEVAMSFATTVEDALKAVTLHQAAHNQLDTERARTETHILDDSYQLDQSRQRRDRAKGEFEALRAKPGLMAFFKGRMEVASLAREQKAREVVEANTHVQELKATIERRRNHVIALRTELFSSETTLSAKRDELRTAVTGLHKTDPRVLIHLLGFLQGAERASLKAAMAKALSPAKPGDTEKSEQAEGESGPRVRPSRSVRGPSR